MLKELQQKKHCVNALARQARLRVIWQKASEPRVQLRRMDEYLTVIETDPNYLLEQGLYQLPQLDPPGPLPGNILVLLDICLCIAVEP
jgi:hypothetical protein